MKFIWEDGFTKEIPVGTKLKGLAHERKRPTSVTFLAEDLAQLGNLEYLEDYLCNIETALK